MKKISLILLLLFTLSACSTYKTSNPEIRFTAAHIDEAPIIPVLTQAPNNAKVDYLGWVDIYVRKPNILAKEASIEQANYVLAYTAKQQGANAVMSVTYKEGLNLTGLKKLFARGQAIRLHNEDNAEKAVEIQSEPTAPLIDNEATETIAIIDSAPVEAIIAPELVSIEKANTIVANNTAILITEKPKATGNVLIIPAKQEKKALEVNTQSPIYHDLNDQLNRMQLIKNNALFLQEKANHLRDKEMQKVAERLLQLVAEQEVYFQELLPMK